MEAVWKRGRCRLLLALTSSSRGGGGGATTCETTWVHTSSLPWNKQPRTLTEGRQQRRVAVSARAIDMSKIFRGAGILTAGKTITEAYV